MAKSLDESEVKFPFYARASLILVGLFVFLSMLVLGKGIIVPFLFAIVVSILLSSIVDFLTKRGIDRIIAITGAMLLTVFVVGLVTVMVISQINMFIDAIPEFAKKLDVLQTSFANWISDSFGVGTRKANEWMSSARADLTVLSGDSIGDTVSTLINALIVLILIPVYIFLLLFYQPLIVDFVHRVIGDRHVKDVGIVLGQTKTLLKAYFAGLLIELVIVAILNSVGLLLLGVEYAILIGIFGAFLNMIPYIGGIITLGLSMLMAMLSNTDPSFALYAAGVFFLIQIIDNYILIPKIVGSKIKINALVAIIVVIAGGAMWGVAGMFLALPLIAILKVIFDRIEPLEPWGFMLGDTMPPMVRIRLRRRKVAAAVAAAVEVK